MVQWQIGRRIIECKNLSWASPTFRRSQSFHILGKTSNPKKLQRVPHRLTVSVAVSLFVSTQLFLLLCTCVHTIDFLQQRGIFRQLPKNTARVLDYFTRGAISPLDRSARITTSQLYASLSGEAAISSHSVAQNIETISTVCMNICLNSQKLDLSFPRQKE